LIASIGAFRSSLSVTISSMPFSAAQRTCASFARDLRVRHQAVPGALGPRQPHRQLGFVDAPRIVRRDHDRADGLEPTPLQEARARLVAYHVRVDPPHADRVEVLLGELPERLPSPRRRASGRTPSQT
jgi:hypothetical protein